MAKREVEVLLFYTSEDVPAARSTRSLGAALTKEGWAVTLVDRFSSKIDQLKLAAKWRAVVLPRWIVRHHGKPVFDEVGVPTVKQARKVLGKLEDK